jgi:putative ABC transport system substrate-binding protein
MADIRRREFVALLGGVAVWPIAAHAQQGEQLRTVGVLMNVAAGSQAGQTRVAAFSQRLREFGWIDGRNLRIETRWAAGDSEGFRDCAAELAALSPAAILAVTSPAVTAVKEVSPTVPIVFVSVVDPVGSGLVSTLRRPGGNATGFLVFEYATSAKWLELLKEVATSATRVAVLRDTLAAGIGQFAAIQTVAPIDLELSVINLDSVSEMQSAIAAFGRTPNGALIVAASGFAVNHAEMIAELATRHRLPAIYPFGYFVAAGGLISYGPNVDDPYRRAAGYVDRILKGERPADLPVQAPTKYELAINLKTAKMMGLDVPATLLARADEVIE